jgi:hypothetical protein
MTTLFDTLTSLSNTFLPYSASQAKLISLLLIIVIIALFVNRQRDSQGNLTFIDRGKAGMIGLRVYAIADGIRQKSWVIPLWSPENNLLLNVKILLPQGDYELKACWKDKTTQHLDTNLFDPQPIDKEKTLSLSKVVKFHLAKPMGIEFRLTAAGKKLIVGSPQKQFLRVSADRTALPLQITDPSIKAGADLIRKSGGKGIWKLSLTDEKILKALQRKVAYLNRKLDSLVVKNKELESNLDQTLTQIKTVSK